MKHFSRRHFLAGTALAGLGPAVAFSPGRVANAASEVSAAGAGMKLGMVTYQMGKDMSVDELIALCQKSGLAGVELRTTHAHKVESDLTGAQRAEVKKKFADAGVAIAGLGTTFDFHSKNPDEVRKSIEGAKEYAQLAADVGALGIKVRPNGVHKDEDREKTYERIGKSLGEVAASAAGLGVQVWLEVHGSEGSKEPASIRKMIDHAGHPNALVCWNCNGGETDDNGSIRANFDLLKHVIGEVHINDIGLPKYPWQELFSLLKEINYQGFCLAEIEYNPQPERFMAYYRTLFDLYTGRYRDPNA